MFRRVAPLALALCLPLFPQAPRQQVQVVTTDRVDFAAGGTIRFEGSEGELNIEGWDEPQVQIVCTRFDYADATDQDKARLKSKLESITVKTEKRSGTELLVTTALPHRNFFARQLRGKTDADMNYRIMVPRDSHLVVHHGDGDVLVYDVAGDVEVTAHAAAIVAQLDDPAQYAIDAHATVGEVYTDYDGKYRRRRLIGESFLAAVGAPAHKVFLRSKVGNISIVKMGTNPIAK
jgi:hypothetical protein